MAVFIDGVEIMNPSDLQVSKSELKTTERTASGRLVADVIAVKRILRFVWGTIKDADIKQILNLLSTSAFHAITYPDPQNGESYTITACIDGNIQFASWRVIGNVRYWDDVSISFVEQ